MIAGAQVELQRRRENSAQESPELPVDFIERLRGAVAWVVEAMDHHFAPSAAAQKLLELLEDDGVLQKSMCGI